jgi:hypothetical protein
MKGTKYTLTTAETDAIILAACAPSDGAIEDNETSATEALYFFESGLVGHVNLFTGAVTIEQQTE